jgi:hypothetical protein
MATVFMKPTLAGSKQFCDDEKLEFSWRQRFGLIPAKATTGALLYRTTVIYESGPTTNAPQ